MANLEALELWLTAKWAAFEAWLNTQVLVWSTLAEAAAVLLLLLPAWLGARPLERRLLAARESWHSLAWQRLAGAVAAVAMPFLWLILVWLAAAAARMGELPHRLLDLAATLLLVWIAVRLATRMMRDSRWTRFLALAAWLVAALNIVGLLQPLRATLDGMAMTVGSVRVSALTVIEGALSLAVLLWLAVVVARLVEGRLSRSAGLAPSLRVLFAKLIRVSAILIAVVLAFAIVGIDLTTFAFMAGALGIGIGFGLQKIVSNFVAGIILLLDRSIKPGDVISVGKTFGWVTSLSARYTSLTTRDGVEHLIPNEVLIAERVENWSFSDNNIRLKVGFGISYDSDVRLAQRIALEVARGIERVLADPPPICHLVNFGDSSVDFELRLWIKDPEEGVSNITSAVRFALWDRFHEAGIAFPYPQRDLHLRSAEGPVRVKLEGGAK